MTGPEIFFEMNTNKSLNLKQNYFVNPNLTTIYHFKILTDGAVGNANLKKF